MTPFLILGIAVVIALAILTFWVARIDRRSRIAYVPLQGDQDGHSVNTILAGPVIETKGRSAANQIDKIMKAEMSRSGLLPSNAPKPAPTKQGRAVTSKGKALGIKDRPRKKSP